MLLGPKSIKSNTAKITITSGRAGGSLKSPPQASGGGSSSLRKQESSNLSATSSSTTGNSRSSMTSSAAAATTVAPTGAITPARRTASSLSTTSSLSSSQQQQQQQQHQQRQSSQSSLLHAGKSTSRSSIVSDTTASVCSSTLNNGSVSTKNVTKNCSSSSASSLLNRTKSPLLSKQSSNTTKTILNASGSVYNSVGIRKTGPSSVSNYSSASSSTSTSTSTSTAKNLSSSSSVAASSSSSNSLSNSRKVPTLAMSLRDKDQQIKLLIKERDEQKFQAELMSKRAEEWEEKFVQSELEKSHVTSEADDEVIELRRLTQELEDENKKLVEKLSKSEQLIGDIQFKLDEIDCERGELKKELNFKEEELKIMELEQFELTNSGKPIKQIETERSISKVKYEKEIEELKERILNKDEQMIQLRSSLEMKKNEVNNLQKHSSDIERKLKIECERSERHLKRIDEINLEFKAIEAKLTTKLEENEIYEKQVKQLRQDLRNAEEKLEQLSLARKKDVDILHNKLSVARRGSTTPTSTSSTPTPNQHQSQSQSPFKTPTPQDEIVRLQMEIRDLKDQLIDREAELDCNKRDMEVLKKKMETRTLEVDCNNQELARRCQDLLEQNRQSEDTIKQLLKSTTDYSTQLLRATEDLKEANGKCIKLRDEINEMELKLDEQMKKCSLLLKENNQLKDDNEEYREQVELLRQQVDSLNEQLSDLCEQLDVQTNNLHKDREALAKQLAQMECNSAQMRHDLDRARQDLRTNKLHTQEVTSERDRLRGELEMKEQYILSRNDIINTMRHELDDCKKSLSEYKIKLEQLLLNENNSNLLEKEIEKVKKELKNQLELLKRDCQIKSEELVVLRVKCEQLEAEKCLNESDELKKFDEMRKKHSIELDELNAKLKQLEEQLEEAKSSTNLKRDLSSILKKSPSEKVEQATSTTTTPTDRDNEDKLIKEAKINTDSSSQVVAMENKQKKEDYETQIEFLNSVVVDMQRKCDDYKNKLTQMETVNIMTEFDNLIMSSSKSDAFGTPNSKASTLKRNHNHNNNSAQQPPTRSDDVGSATLTKQTNQQSKNNNLNSNNNNNNNNNINLNGFMTLDNKAMRISGRPYCDICNVYDSHHTVYCPKVNEKLASRNLQLANATNGTNTAYNNNNNNNDRNISNNNGYIDDFYREYEQSLQSASSMIQQQFNSLRRPQGSEKQARPYCDHCDLFGHTIKSCNSLKT